MIGTPVRVIEILGPGCARCRETHRVVTRVIEEARLTGSIQKRMRLLPRRAFR